MNAAGNLEISIMTSNQQAITRDKTEKNPKNMSSCSHKMPPTTYQERLLLKHDQVLETGNCSARMAGTVGHVMPRSMPAPAATALGAQCLQQPRGSSSTFHTH